MRYVHCRICIWQENQKWGKWNIDTVGRRNMSRTVTNEENETQTMQDLDYGEKTENHGNEKHTLQDVKYGEEN